MSDNAEVIVGLKEGKLKEDDKNRLYYVGYGYENGAVWTYKPEPRGGSVFQPIDNEIVKEDDKGSIYGIGVVGTWNGLIDLEEISDQIEKAKGLFKKITGQEGKVYFVGEQV